MANYNTVEDLDIVLESANNIEAVLYRDGKWTIDYKNNLNPDVFNTCREMMEFLICDQNS